MPAITSQDLGKVLARSTRTVAAARSARDRSREIRIEGLVRRLRPAPTRIDRASETVLRAHLGGAPLR
ncbi:hypothetical protein [Actinomycetospora aeridis]|uniref:Uncharacterized protein n=1 Tax=Actinomycetospora aeridis TaxID=3129231 RepID=A0ABU8N734_9PSEU